MLAEHDGRTMAVKSDAFIDEVDATPADRSMAIMQWGIATIAAVAAILLASVR